MFYTPVSIDSIQNKINLSDPVITAGSCFADCMGKKLEENKFQILTNPFGTVYNPLSLNKQFTAAIKNEIVDRENLAQLDEQFFHFDYHSQFHSNSKESLIKVLKTKVKSVYDFLPSAKWFIITWGTAWVYQLNRDDSVVANCHKQPQKQFSKRIIYDQEIIEDFNKFYNLLKEMNPHIQVILTISPVRHIKDTLTFNSVSKSILRVAAHKLAHNYNDIHYFPAYEILMDELRDYRFYKKDMIHPTEQAEDYIWEKFISFAIEHDTAQFINEWQKIRSSIAHRSFNSTSDAHQKFLKSLLKKVENLSNKVNVDEEIKRIKNKILN